MDELSQQYRQGFVWAIRDLFNQIWSDSFKSGKGQVKVINLELVEAGRGIDVKVQLEGGKVYTGTVNPVLSEIQGDIPKIIVKNLLFFLSFNGRVRWLLDRTHSLHANATETSYTSSSFILNKDGEYDIAVKNLRVRYLR